MIINDFLILLIILILKILFVFILLIKEISVKELFDETNNYITINKLLDSNYLSSNINLNKDIDNYEGLKCKEHNLNFEYFCGRCLLNICKECEKNHESHSNLIEFKSIKVDNDKLNEIITKINEAKKDDINFLYEALQNNKLIKANDNYEIITEKDINDFNKLIRIIINDYQQFPNFSHYFNIKNIINFYFVNECKRNIKNVNNEINIEYINNKSTINLFSEKFVKRNKDKLYLKIKGKEEELKVKYNIYFHGQKNKTNNKI